MGVWTQYSSENLFWSSVQKHGHWRDGEGGEMGRVFFFCCWVFFPSSIEREAVLLQINHSGISWDLFAWFAPRKTQREIWHLSHCTIRQTARQEIGVLHLSTSPPHTFPARHGSHVLDTMAHQRSSRSPSLTIPSSAVPSHQRALEAEEEFVHSAVCLDKVHVETRWWTALLGSFGVEGYSVFSWRRFHMPRFE